MYWWIIFWAYVTLTILQTVFPLFKREEASLSDLAKAISYIISTSIHLWINISILVFMWQNLLK